MKIEEYKLLDNRYAVNLEGSDERWERMVDFYYKGVKEKLFALKELSKVFPSKYKNAITLTELKADGLCPHHFLPTHYRAEVSYVPKNGFVVGTSKAYIAFRAIVGQPILMEDIFEEFFNEFLDKVKPASLKLKMWGKYECNHKDGVSKNAEVILEKQI